MTTDTREWWATPLPELIDDLTTRHGQDPEALAALFEHWQEVKDAMESRAAMAHALRDRCAALMERTLGEGEAVVAPSGRIAYLDEVSDGKAGVRAEAIDEHAEHLPTHLRPRQVTRYPTVTDLRKALRERAIDRATFAAIVDEPPRRMGLRWRTLTPDAPEMEAAA